MPGFIKSLRWDMGQVDPLAFSKDCHTGDWQTKHISFSTDFLNASRIRILITPNVTEVRESATIAAVVPIAKNVTRTGFDLSARSSDCSAGSTEFHWIAVSDDPPSETPKITVRVGLLPCKHFEPDCVHGDWAIWDSYRYPRAFNYWCPENESGDETHVVVSPGNLFVSNLSATVGAIDARGLTFPHRDRDGFNLRARNSDCVAGESMFYYLAASKKCSDPFPQKLFIDDADIWIEHTYEPDCRHGDWFTQDVYFSHVFITPPVVLVTANDRGFEHAHIHTAAVVGVITNVTTHGFTLRTRNSDCSSGRTGFYFVAIGCLEKDLCTERS